MTLAMADRLRSFGRRFSREVLQPSEPEAVSNKPLPTVGLFALLSDEQKRKALLVDQDESFGPNEHRRANGC